MADSHRYYWTIIPHIIYPLIAVFRFEAARINCKVLLALTIQI